MVICRDQGKIVRQCLSSWGISMDTSKIAGEAHRLQLTKCIAGNLRVLGIQFVKMISDGWTGQ